MCVRIPIRKRTPAQTRCVAGSTPAARILRADSPTRKRPSAQTRCVEGSTPSPPICGGLAELVMRPAATRYTVTRAQVRVLQPPLLCGLEGGAERSATGLENRARVTPEGSIPSPSVTRRKP